MPPRSGKNRSESDWQLQSAAAAAGAVPAGVTGGSVGVAGGGRGAEDAVQLRQRRVLV